MSFKRFSVLFWETLCKFSLPIAACYHFQLNIILKVIYPTALKAIQVLLYFYVLDWEEIKLVKEDSFWYLGKALPVNQVVNDVLFL